MSTEEIKETTAEKPYTLRRLNDEDLFTVVEIIGVALPEEAKQAFAQKFAGTNNADGENNVNKIEKRGAMIGFDIVKYIMKNIKACKNEVYSLLSDLSGIPADEIRTMPFGTTPKMLKEIFENEKDSDFFTEVSKLLS